MSFRPEPQRPHSVSFRPKARRAAAEESVKTTIAEGDSTKIYNIKSTIYNPKTLATILSAVGMLAFSKGSLIGGGTSAAAIFSGGASR